MKEEDYLIKECEIISNRILSVWLNSVRIIAIGTTLIIGLIGLAYKEEKLDIIILLPFGFFFMLYYAVYLFTEVNALGGYKKFIEEKLNKKAGVDIFLWESEVSSSIRICIPTMLLFLFVGLLLIASIYFSIHFAYDNYSKNKTILLGVAFTLLFVGLFSSFISMNKKFNKTYQFAMNIGAEREKRKCEDSRTPDPSDHV